MAKKQKIDSNALLMDFSPEALKAKAKTDPNYARDVLGQGVAPEMTQIQDNLAQKKQEQEQLKAARTQDPLNNIIGEGLATAVRPFTHSLMTETTGPVLLFKGQDLAEDVDPEFDDIQKAGFIDNINAERQSRGQALLTSEEANMLKKAKNLNHAYTIKNRLDTTARIEQYNSQQSVGTGLLSNVAASFLDPAQLALGIASGGAGVAAKYGVQALKAGKVSKYAGSFAGNVAELGTDALSGMAVGSYVKENQGRAYTGEDAITDAVYGMGFSVALGGAIKAAKTAVPVVKNWMNAGQMKLEQTGTVDEAITADSAKMMRDDPLTPSGLPNEDIKVEAVPVARQSEAAELMPESVKDVPVDEQDKAVEATPVADTTPVESTPVAVNTPEAVANAPEQVETPAEPVPEPVAPTTPEQQAVETATVAEVSTEPVAQPQPAPTSSEIASPASFSKLKPASTKALPITVKKAVRRDTITNATTGINIAGRQIETPALDALRELEKQGGYTAIVLNTIRKKGNKGTPDNVARESRVQEAIKEREARKIAQLTEGELTRLGDNKDILFEKYKDLTPGAFNAAIRKEIRAMDRNERIAELNALKEQERAKMEAEAQARAQQAETPAPVEPAPVEPTKPKRGRKKLDADLLTPPEAKPTPVEMAVTETDLKRQAEIAIVRQAIAMEDELKAKQLEYQAKLKEDLKRRAEERRAQRAEKLKKDKGVDVAKAIIAEAEEANPLPITPEVATLLPEEREFVSGDLELQAIDEPVLDKIDADVPVSIIESIPEIQEVRGSYPVEVINSDGDAEIVFEAGIAGGDFKAVEGIDNITDARSDLMAESVKETKPEEPAFVKEILTAERLQEITDKLQRLNSMSDLDAYEAVNDFLTADGLLDGESLDVEDFSNQILRVARGELDFNEFAYDLATLASPEVRKEVLHQLEMTKVKLADNVKEQMDLIKRIRATREQSQVLSKADADTKKYTEEVVKPIMDLTRRNNVDIPVLQRLGVINSAEARRLKNDPSLPLPARPSQRDLSKLDSETKAQLKEIDDKYEAAVEEFIMIDDMRTQLTSVEQEVELLLKAGEFSDMLKKLSPDSTTFKEAKSNMIRVVYNFKDVAPVDPNMRIAAKKHLITMADNTTKRSVKFATYGQLALHYAYRSKAGSPSASYEKAMAYLKNVYGMSDDSIHKAAEIFRAMLRDPEFDLLSSYQTNLLKTIKRDFDRKAMKNISMLDLETRGILRLLTTPLVSTGNPLTYYRSRAELVRLFMRADLRDNTAYQMFKDKMKDLDVEFELDPSVEVFKAHIDELRQASKKAVAMLAKKYDDLAEKEYRFQKDYYDALAKHTKGKYTIATSSGMDDPNLYSRRLIEATTPAAKADVISEMLKDGAGLKGVSELYAKNKIVVVETVADLPPSRDTLGHPDDVAGMYRRDTDITYIVAENVNPGYLPNLVMHEVGVHAGMEGLIGADRWNALKTEALQSAEFAEIREAISDRVHPTHLAEETIAYAVEYAPESSFVKNLLSMVREALRKLLGLVDADDWLKYTTDDVAYLAKRAILKKARDSSVVSYKDAGTGWTNDMHSLSGMLYNLSGKIKRQEPDAKVDTLNKVAGRMFGFVGYGYKASDNPIMRVFGRQMFSNDNLKGGGTIGLDTIRDVVHGTMTGGYHQEMADAFDAYMAYTHPEVNMAESWYNRADYVEEFMSQLTIHQRSKGENTTNEALKKAIKIQAKWYAKVLDSAKRELADLKANFSGDVEGSMISAWGDIEHADDYVPQLFNLDQFEDIQTKHGATRDEMVTLLTKSLYSKGIADGAGVMISREAFDHAYMVVEASIRAQEKIRDSRQLQEDVAFGARESLAIALKRDGLISEDIIDDVLSVILDTSPSRTRERKFNFDMNLSTEIKGRRVYVYELFENDAKTLFEGYANQAATSAAFGRALKMGVFSLGDAKEFNLDSQGILNTSGQRLPSFITITDSGEAHIDYGKYGAFEFMQTAMSASHTKDAGKGHAELMERVTKVRRALLGLSVSEADNTTLKRVMEISGDATTAVRGSLFAVSALFEMADRFNTRTAKQAYETIRPAIKAVISKGREDRQFLIDLCSEFGGMVGGDGRLAEKLPETVADNGKMRSAAQFSRNFAKNVMRIMGMEHVTRISKTHAVMMELNWLKRQAEKQSLGIELDKLDKEHMIRHGIKEEIMSDVLNYIDESLYQADDGMYRFKPSNKYSSIVRNTASAYVQLVMRKSVSESSIGKKSSLELADSWTFFGKFLSPVIQATGNKLIDGAQHMNHQVISAWTASLIGGAVSYVAISMLRCWGDDEKLAERLTPSEIMKNAFNRASFMGMLPRLMDMSLIMGGGMPVFAGGTYQDVFSLEPAPYGTIKDLGVAVGTVPGLITGNTSEARLKRSLQVVGGAPIIALGFYDALLSGALDTKATSKEYRN